MRLHRGIHLRGEVRITGFGTSGGTVTFNGTPATWTGLPQVAAPATPKCCAAEIAFYPIRQVLSRRRIHPMPPVTLSHRQRGVAGAVGDRVLALLGHRLHPHTSGKRRGHDHAVSTALTAFRALVWGVSSKLAANLP
jgi:hypothetical protein